MKRFSLTGLRTRLVGLVLAAMLPLIGLVLADGILRNVVSAPKPHHDTVPPAPDDDLSRHLLLTIGAVVVAVSAVWIGSDFMMLRRVHALAAAARRMRDGELTARTGLGADGDELGELAGTLDQMAAALHQRDTERLRAADALRQSHDQLEVMVRERAAELAKEHSLLHSLVENLPDYVYVKNTEGRYIVDNAAHRRLVGAKTADEVIGRTVFDLFPKELAAQYHQDDVAVLETGVPLLRRDEDVQAANGQRIRISTTKVPLRDKTGKIIGLVGVGREVTPAKV